MISVGGTRTPNMLVLNQPPLPLGYRALSEYRLLRCVGSFQMRWWG